MTSALKKFVMKHVVERTTALLSPIYSRLCTFLRLVALTMLIVLSGAVVLGTFITSPALAAPVSVNLCFKTGSELDLNGALNVNTKDKLTNLAYFGPTGNSAPETFVFNSLSSVTSTTLSNNGCQIYFGGGNPDVTSTEATVINSWAQSQGHFVIAGCDYTSNVICSSFGRTLTSIPNGGVSINSLLSYNPLTCGGALTVGTFGGASTYFGVLAGDVLLAKHNTASQQPAAITDSLVTPKFLFSGDADMYGSNGASAIGAGATASTDQAKFVINSFKFALDAIMGRLGNPQCFASYNQKADLEISISTSNASPVVGGQTTVTITVENQGPNNVTGVTAIANLPAGLGLASQAGTGSYSAATQAWSIGSLNNGASASITLTLNVNGAGSFSIPAQITQSSLPDIDSSTNVGFGVDDLSDGIVDDDEASVSITAIANNPKLVLVKRITAINTGTITTVVDPNTTADPNDNEPNWPSGYLQGAIDGGIVRPGDEVEYTIYFLSSGDSPATSVLVCDLVPANSTFNPRTFNGLTPTDGGLPGADSGLVLAIGSTTTYLTNAKDSDRGEFFVGGTTPATACSGTNNNGAVVVNIVKGASTLPNATAPGTPNNSHGFIRFRAKVN